MRNSFYLSLRSLVLPCILALVLLPAAAASANVITFNVSGTAQNVSGSALGSCAAYETCSFSGTLPIDVTSGTVTGIDITFPGLVAFDDLGPVVGSESGLWEVTATNDSFPQVLSLRFPTSGSLVGFNGASLMGMDVDIPRGQLPPLLLFYSNTGGTISAPVAVPGPGSLGLMLLGLGLFILFSLRARTRAPRRWALRE